MSPTGVAGLLLAALLAPVAQAETEAEAFARVQPILERHCALCHSGPKASQGLRLDAGQVYPTAVNTRARSSRLQLVAPGRPDDSLLYRKLLPHSAADYRGARMPFNLEPLSDEEIAQVRTWILSFPPELWGEPAAAAEMESDRTFHDSHLANLPTTDSLAPGAFQFRILHRLKASATAAGIENLYGLDGGAWISLGLAYGISKRWEAGLRHSNFQQAEEGYFKLALLRQEGRMPVSLSYHGNVSYLRAPGSFNRTRLGAQLLIARQFGSRFSVLLAPTYQSRTQFADRRDRSGTAAVGIGGQYRLTDVMAVTGEWVAQIDGVKAPYQGASVGFSIATARHGFHLLLTNTPGMHSDAYAPGGDQDPSHGDFRIGFNISRLYGGRH